MGWHAQCRAPKRCWTLSISAVDEDCHSKVAEGVARALEDLGQVTRIGTPRPQSRIPGL